jgi:hypothetical protein
LTEEFYEVEHLAMRELKRDVLSTTHAEQIDSSGAGHRVDDGTDKLRQLNALLQAGGGPTAMSQQARKASEANEVLRSKLAELMRSTRSASSSVEMTDAGCQMAGTAGGSSEDSKQMSCTGLGRRSTAIRNPGAAFDGGNHPGFQSSPNCARASLIDESRHIGANSDASLGQVRA